MKITTIDRSGNAVIRDMTPEEEETYRKEKNAIPDQEPTPEERLDALETTTDDMILLMAEMIGGE